MGITTLGVLLISMFLFGSATPEVSIIVSVERPVPILFLRQTLESLSKQIVDPAYQVILVQVGNLGYERDFEFQRVLQQKEYQERVLVLPGVSRYKKFLNSFLKGIHGESHAKAINRASHLAIGKYLVFMESFIEVAHPNTFSVMTNILNNDKSNNYLGVAYSLQGFSSAHPLSNSRREVLGVTKKMMMIETSIFRQVHGFDEAFQSDILLDMDLSLRVSKLGKKVVVDPNALAFHNNKDIVLGEVTYENDFTRNDLSTFSGRWREEKWPKFAISNMTLIWNTECGSGQVLGFTAEAIHFVMSLRHKVMLRVEVGMGREKECYDEIVKLGYPIYVIKALNRMMDVVLVLHRDPGRYNWFLNSHVQRKNYFVIGRSMYETDSIPSDWITPCNSDDIDEIWVPTQFNVDTFQKAGVNGSKLSVVPELTDVLHFEPNSHSPLIPRHEGIFKFLSIMKWEERKAWKSMFTAYFDEFRGVTENVRLMLLARLDDDSKQKYEDFVRSYLNETNSDIGDLPPVDFINHFVPYSLLPSLYNSADAFVLASHGEGWGLPLMEAMAMKKPTIGTNWGGNLAFMNSLNSFLVDVVGMEDANNPNHKWATPSVESLRRIMRSLVNNVDAASVVAQARNDVVAKFSYEPVSDIIIEKLRAIQTKLPEVRRRKSTTPTSWRSWGGSQSGGHRVPTPSSPTPSGVPTPNLEPVFTDDKGIVRYRAKIIND